MKFNVPPAGSVSPCVRLFLESLISDVDDPALLWQFEAEQEDMPGRFVGIDDARSVSRAGRLIF